MDEAIAIYCAYTQTDVYDALNQQTIQATAHCFTNDLSMSSDYYNDLQLWLHETIKSYNPLIHNFISLMNYYSHVIIDTNHRKSNLGHHYVLGYELLLAVVD